MPPWLVWDWSPSGHKGLRSPHCAGTWRRGSKLTDPAPGWACCSPAYPSERCLHPRDRQHRFRGAAELAFGTQRRAGLLEGEGAGCVVFCHFSSFRFGSLCAGGIGGWIPLSGLEKRPGESGLETSCCLSASGGCCSGHPRWFTSCGHLLWLLTV